MSRPTTVALAQDISRLRETQFELSRYKSLTLRNQIHLEFKSEQPIILNDKYVTKIKNYCQELNLNVYDVLSNGRDRVYVYATPAKPRSPVGVVRPTIKDAEASLKEDAARPKTPVSPSSKPTNVVKELSEGKNNLEPSAAINQQQIIRTQPKSDNLSNNSAVQEISFNGQKMFTPVVFVKSETLNPIKPEPEKAKPVAIPENYSTLQYNTFRLTNNENFTRLRKFLACYTGKISHVDLGILHETDGYLSLKTQLVNEGFPREDQELRKLYFDFLVGRGFDTFYIEKDLEKLKMYYDNSHMIRSNQVKTNFKTYYYGNTSGGERYITEKGSTHNQPGRGTPDVCVVV